MRFKRSMAARTEIPPSEGVRDAGGGDAAHSLPAEPSGAPGSGSMVQQKQVGLNGWFAELKRRRVVRTLVGYGPAPCGAAFALRSCS